MFEDVLRYLSYTPLAIWVGLLFFRSGFWQGNQNTTINLADLDFWPDVVAIIPARNEAPSIGITVSSILEQDYPGSLSVILVDDNSNDSTVDIALAAAGDKENRLTVIRGQPLVKGWSGKLWAINQGIESSSSNFASKYILLTDADIFHTPENLRWLVSKAETCKLDLVSEMVMLHCKSFWEKLLIPAFIFFFQKLYPFGQVNNPRSSVAAAAGGCILIRREALSNAGGIQAIKDRLIDDCSLATIIKANGPIWLGLTERASSLRVYDRLDELSHMVVRTAFVQLDNSVFKLFGTVLGMIITYLAAPVIGIYGLVIDNEFLIRSGFSAWFLMASLYFPTLRLYKVSLLWSIFLPVSGIIYTLMTVNSAWQYWAGRGGAWKGRSYPS